MQQENWTTVDIKVPVRGVTLGLKVSVPDFPVKPQAMLPLFQQISSKFSDIAQQVVVASGKSISCKAGCGACCRQPVPLSEIEIYHIAQLVEAMPEPRRGTLKARFASAAAQLYTSGWYQRSEQCKDEEEATALAFEYFAHGIYCPFLEQGSCSIYEHRPIICREYLVTSPAELCDTPGRAQIARVELPASATHGTCRVAKSSNMKRQNYQLLVFALMWAEQYPEPFAEKTGREWLAEFFGTEAVSG